MRVIGGSARGTTLVGPPGPETRATGDKVRGAIYNRLAHDIADARVLDLYAGTGALGIEALSRGAESCLFVERSRRACDVIEKNLVAARVRAGGHIMTMPVARAIALLADGGSSLCSTFTPPYDLLLLDPPYDERLASTVLKTIVAGGLLASGGVLVLEHAARGEAPGDLVGVGPPDARRYGDTMVSIWRCPGGRGER